MSRMRKKPDRAALALLGVLTLAFLWVMWPYASALFWAVVLAIMLDPMWQALQRRVKAPKPALALFMILSVILLIIVPLIGAAALLPGQIQALSANLPELHDKFVSGMANIEQMLPASLAEELRKIGSSNSGPLQLSSLLNNLGGWLSSLAVSTMTIFVMATVALYVLFFLLMDGRGMFAAVCSYLPFERDLMEMLACRFVEIVKSTVGGVFAIALIQGLVCGIVMIVLGVQPALIFAILTTIASLIPAVGSGLVWIPVSIYLLSQGEVAKALMLVFAGIFIIGMVDNLLRPRLVGRGTRIPDFLILVTTLGGLSLMGAAGIVIGPMIAGLCLSMWQSVAQSDAVADS